MFSGPRVITAGPWGVQTAYFMYCTVQ